MTERRNLRELMPKAAQWVDEQRSALGVEYVNACIKRSLAGEVGWFYVVERVAPDTFKTLGTPTDLWTPEQYELIGRCFVGVGVDLYQYIRMPNDIQGDNDGQA